MPRLTARRLTAVLMFPVPPMNKTFMVSPKWPLNST